MAEKVLGASAKIKKFLGLFGTVYGGASNVQICASIDKVRNSRMKNLDSVEEALRLNKTGSDIYFYINRGGTKKTDIEYLSSCYIDLDAGRDKNGKYLSLAKVAEKKKAMMAKIESLHDLKPSIIVETRNGYHLYWRLKDSEKSVSLPSVTKLQSWKLIQSKLYTMFKDVGGDAKAQKENQIFRVPFTMWNKTHEGCEDTFMTKLVYQDKRVFTLSELGHILKDVKIVNRVRPSASFTNKIPQCFAKPAKPAKPQLNNSELLSEVVDFLNEVSTILNYSNHKFLGKQASKLAQNLMTEITLC